jgi:CHAD domain-containing protein
LAQKLLPVLEKNFWIVLAITVKKIRNMIEFFQSYFAASAVFIDSTESLI